MIDHARGWNKSMTDYFSTATAKLTEMEGSLATRIHKNAAILDMRCVQQFYGLL